MGTVRRIASATAALLVALGVGAPIAGAAQGELTGTFQITAGECTAGGVDGAYLRLILPSGSPDGPFVGNGDSPCDDQTYTPLAPGRDGGLVVGGYQPDPDPPFDGSGNGLADRITAPAAFFGVAFSTSTNPVDPQTGVDAPAPSIRLDGGVLSGNLSAFAATWNAQQFNQGAPKPDGSMPGLTAEPTGTLDTATGAYVLEWRSHIQGGPFNGFTGVWHLEGTFTPAASPTSATTAPPPTTTPGSPSTTTADASTSSTTTAPDQTDGAAPDTPEGGAPDGGTASTQPAPAVDLAVTGDDQPADAAAPGGPGDTDDGDGGPGAGLALVALAALAGAAAMLYRVVSGARRGRT